MLTNMDSLFNIADAFDALENRQSGSDQDLESFQESLGHTLSSHSLGGRSAFSWAPPVIEGLESESSDDDDEVYGSIRFAVESMLDLDDKDCHPMKTPYFTSLTTSPRGSLSTVVSSARGSVSATSPSRISSMSRLFGQPHVPHGDEGQPRSLQPSPSNSFRAVPTSQRSPNPRGPHPQPVGSRAPRVHVQQVSGLDALSRQSSSTADFFHQPAQTSDLFTRQASGSLSPEIFTPQAKVPEIMFSPAHPWSAPPVPAPAPAPGPSPAAPGAVDIDPRCLQSGGVITIGGQAYILMPAAAVLGSVTPPPEAAPLVAAPAIPTPTAPTGSLTPTYRPSPRMLSQRPRHISPTHRAPPRPKATASASFPNIQVLSDKVDSTAEHGYYLSDTATTAPATPAIAVTAATPSATASEVAPAQPQPPVQSFPTYTYDYGNEVDQGVWDILRKSMQKGPSA